MADFVPETAYAPKKKNAVKAKGKAKPAKMATDVDRQASADKMQKALAKMAVLMGPKVKGY